MLTKYLGIALFLSFLALGVAGKVLTSEIEDHAVTKANLVTKGLELDAYTLAISKMVEDQTMLRKSAEVIRSEYAKEVRELSYLKNRENVVLAKKTLVTLRINKAYKKQQLRFACITGDNLACGKP